MSTKNLFYAYGRIGRCNMSSNQHVVTENGKPCSLLQKKSTYSHNEVPGREFKLTEPCKMTRRNMAKVCPCIAICLRHQLQFFASEVSWLSPQAVVPWITFNPNSSWASDKETRCLPQDSGLLCKGNYLKVWCAAQALNWIQPVICSTIGWPSRAFYSTTWKQMQKKWQCSTTKLFYWLYKLPHSTALGWLWIFQCSAPLQFHI